MKKIINILSGSAILGGLMIFPTSCKKSFLDEEVVNARTTADFITTDGLDGLTIGSTKV